MVDPIPAGDPTVLTPAPEAPKPTKEEILFKGDPPEKKETPAAPVAPAKPGEPTPDPKAAKPEDPKPPEVPEKKPGQEPAKPDAKEYDLKVPEGSLLTKEEVETLTKQAKESGLTQEQAEARLAERDTSVKAYETRRKEAETKLVSETVKQWAEDCKKDSIIGGEKYAENIRLAELGFKAIADVELQDWVRQTGYGNHPAVVRAFLKLGRMMADDKLIRGSVEPAAPAKSAEERLYGKTTPTA